MYLISLYLDNKSATRMQGFINKVAEKSGNNFMTYNKVPPHITIAAFETDEENRVIEILDEKIKNTKSSVITLGSIGVFKSSIIFLAPVLNEYLHNISVSIYEGMSSLEYVSINKYYIPFNWMPHVTIAKKLTSDELMLAFQELERNFTIFNGMITKIALSKTNPLRDIIVWELKNK